MQFWWMTIFPPLAMLSECKFLSKSLCDCCEGSGESGASWWWLHEICISVEKFLRSLWMVLVVSCGVGRWPGCELSLCRFWSKMKFTKLVEEIHKIVELEEILMRFLRTKDPETNQSERGQSQAQILTTSAVTKAPHAPTKEPFCYDTPSRRGLMSDFWLACLRKNSPQKPPEADSAHSLMIDGLRCSFLWVCTLCNFFHFLQRRWFILLFVVLLD